MNIEKYPENTTVSLEDFKNCKWQKAIEDAKTKGYVSMWEELSSFARKAIEEKRFSEGKVLWLLADACSMRLKISLNEPFKPFISNSSRTAILEDFQQKEIEFFEQIIEEINEPRLCSRIADIIWLLKKPRDRNFALKAIGNYRQIPLTTETWVRDGNSCWERAIQLCLMLKTGSGNQLAEIESIIVETIQNSTSTDGFLASWLAELLVKYKLGNQTIVSEKLEKLGTKFENVGNLHNSEIYFDTAAEFYKTFKKQEKFIEMTVKVAEILVKKAVDKQTSNQPSNISARNFYEDAVKKYRTVPKEFRATYNVNNRIAELRVELNSAGEKSLAEMSIISSDPIDITKSIENSINYVTGKTISEALLALANIYHGAEVQKFREFSEKLLKEHPLQAIISGVYMSKDGQRVVAKKPNYNEMNEDVLWPEMVKYYLVELDLIVRANIWPALEIVRQEHRIKENDFYLIAKQSPIVPDGRERLIAKALFSGYDNDFITSLHILIPQIEHLVRIHLKQIGVKTSTLDSNGIETEKGLSTLMEKPEVDKIFGEDLAFELKALLCSPYGPNLRNELAHGLLDYNESQSNYSIYTWWLGLKIVFNTFWNAKK